MRIWFSICLTLRPSCIGAKDMILHLRIQNSVYEGTGNLKSASVKADLGQTQLTSLVIIRSEKLFQLHVHLTGYYHAEIIISLIS